LPDTKSDMAIPMLLGDKLIGVLDVQSDMTDRFTTQDVHIKTILAEQIAVTVENARSPKCSVLAMKRSVLSPSPWT